ncbi:MAG: hypothetical protein R6X31_13070 [Anaerolineae bacterium]
MMTHRLPLLLLVLSLIFVTGPAGWAQGSDEACRYFPETEQYVCGSFLEFFESRGGLEIFGYPLSPSCQDPTHGNLRIQYFQRARFELHPDAPPAYRVQLGLLADELDYIFPPVPEEKVPRSNTPLHHYFPETRHTVSYAFLDYFREHGGIDIFGYPRSEFMHEAGRVVQYFQRAKMEWHPESPRDSLIELTNLGEEYLDRFGPPPGCDQEAVPSRESADALATVAASSHCRYFEETQHYVCDDFLDFFEAHDGLRVFGYPLTEAFADPTRGHMRVQYFQRARMEWHPEAGTDGEVQLGLLADELGYTFPPIRPDRIPSSDDETRRYFPETGHTVEHQFLQFFRENGGVTMLGYPRSEMTFEDGEIVQYFQRARLVWDPAEQSHYGIKLANLGEIYVERIGIPGDYDRPLPPSRHKPGAGSEDDVTPPPSLTQLKATASVRHPVAESLTTQTLYLYVQDQRERPVEGAAPTAVIRYPDRQDVLMMSLTDPHGFSQLSFQVRPANPKERIVIDVIVVNSHSTLTVQTFFVTAY